MPCFTEVMTTRLFVRGFPFALGVVYSLKLQILMISVWSIALKAKCEYILQLITA